MEFGLTEAQKKILIGLFEQYLSAGKVIVYGSRAKGHFTDRSDLDLVIQNLPTQDQQILADLKDAIDESDFPYLTDIQFFETIKNKALKDHIIRVGKVLYSKKADYEPGTGTGSV